MPLTPLRFRHPSHLPSVLCKSVVSRRKVIANDWNSQKSQPKPATANKAGSKRGRRARGGRAPNASRPKRKTVEELDAEMVDYFGGENQVQANAPNGQQATNGGEDLGMAEISVSS